MLPIPPHLDQVSFLYKPEEDEDPPHYYHPPLSLYYFPTPFEDDDVLLFQHQQHHELSLDQVAPFDMKELASPIANDHHHPTAAATTTTTTTTTTSTASTNMKMVDWDASRSSQIPRRSRGCKRDRHSKIDTARGPRDRRMRLSLQVARSFFGLQDALGFDKASKTVEWLLIQSRDEIDKLVNYNRTSPAISSVSCEAVDEAAAAAAAVAAAAAATAAAATNISIISSNNGGGDVIASGVDKVTRGGNKGSGRRQLVSKGAFKPLAKAARDKARARARERTREKNKNKNNHKQDLMMSRLTSTSWTGFDTGGEQSAGTHSQNNMNFTATTTSRRDPKAAEAAARCEVEEELISSTSQEMVNGDANMGKWSPSAIFSTGISQEQQQQLVDLQFYGKPWEVYNNGTHHLF